MSLEAVMTEMTTALNRVAALLEAGGTLPKTETASTAKADKPAATAKADKPKADAGPKFTADEVKAMAVKVKETLGQPAAKKLIKEAGGADALASIDKKNYAAFMAACEAALTPAADDAAEEDEDEL